MKLIFLIYWKFLSYYLHHRFKVLAILLTKELRLDLWGRIPLVSDALGSDKNYQKNRSYPKWMKNHIFTNFDMADPNRNFVFMHLLTIPFKSCYNVQIGYFFEIINQNEKIRGKCICRGYPGTHTVHKTIVIIYIF